MFVSFQRLPNEVQADALQAGMAGPLHEAGSGVFGSTSNDVGHSLGVLVINGDSLGNNIRIERLNFGNTGAFRVFADGRYVSIECGGSYQPSLNASNVEPHGNGGSDTVWTDSLAGFRGWTIISMATRARTC